MSPLNDVFSHLCRRTVSFAIVFAFAITLFFCPVSLHAQTCPGDPGTFEHGELTVLEGPVVAGGAGAVSRGQDPAVAIDDPAVGGARFIVTWVTDLMEGTRIWYDEVLAVGFTADGICIRDPEIMSNENPTCPLTYNCTLSHYHPSVAMSTDHRVRIGTVENMVVLTAGGRDPGLPGTLLLADFDFNTPSWP